MEEKIEERQNINEETSRFTPPKYPQEKKMSLTKKIFWGLVVLVIFIVVVQVLVADKYKATVW